MKTNNKKTLCVENENFIHIFYQGYRRFGSSPSLSLSRTLRFGPLALLDSHLLLAMRASLAHIQKKGNTHTLSHAESEVEHFLGDFSMYTHSIYKYIHRCIYNIYSFYCLSCSFWHTYIIFTFKYITWNNITNTYFVAFWYC